MNKPELLAPAGNADCLKAAILAGADAVYLAGKRFGARAFAGNFDEENLKWARKVTKANNKKLYITLNTIVFEHEWHLLCEALDFLEALQPDSLIIQDIGIAVELRKRGSSIPLHLSTQGAWFGQGGIEELKELGITRVILPRETTKDEIAEIVKKSPFEIEVFVHGAMCYSISGRCFWSAALGTRSGNRGTCAQPCRREYCLENSKHSNCVFSPKDLRLIGQIKALKETGVTSLKIEGRMKSPEYVFQVIKAYRNAIDEKKINENELDEVFSRASSIGFFKGIQKPEIWKTGNNPGREGIVVGITTGKKNNGLTEVTSINNISNGDGLFWFEKDDQKGARITFVKTTANPKVVWVRGLPLNIPPKTELRRTSKSNDEKWENKWNKNLERFPLELNWFGKKGSVLSLNTSFNNKKIYIKSEELLSEANQKGLEDGPIEDKFNLIGEDFRISNNNYDNLQKKLFISATALKNIKRSLLEQLIDIQKIQLLSKKPLSQSLALIEVDNNLTINKNDSLSIANHIFPLRLRLWNGLDILNPILLKNLTDSLVIPWNHRNKLSKDFDQSKISYWLPPILNSKQFNEIYNELKNLNNGKFLCFGWEAFKLSKLLPQLSFELDWCFNVANINSLNYIRLKNLDAVLSKEWKIEDILDNLKAYRSSFAWNPLVSYTRFSNAIQNNKEVTNSHKDKFFTLTIGNNVTAMFLEKNLNKLPKEKDYLQIDVAISPNEDPIEVLKRLETLF